MRIYMDVCCLNRPFDNQLDNRIHLETESIKIILEKIETTDWVLISSDVIDFEIDKIPDFYRKRKVKTLSRFFDEKIHLNDAIIQKAKIFHSFGVKNFDALHISCAIEARANVFLTTDRDIIYLYKKHIEKFNILVSNPLDWIDEVI